jgi:Domain of unknown function (DUF5666)
MTSHYRLTMLIVASVLAACNGATGSRNGDSGGNNPPPSSSPPPPPSHNYVGALWGEEAVGIELWVGSPCASHLGFESSATGNDLGCADLTMDGAAVSVDSLRTGQVIELYLNPADPERTAWVDIHRTAVGAVDALDAAHAQMTVLGQRVYVTDVTAIYGNAFPDGDGDLGALAVGDRVTVAGHFSADGQVMASLIQQDAGPGEVLLRGVLADGANGLFRIGELQVDLSGASLEGFPGDAPLAGDTVLLLADQDPQNGVLVVRSARDAGHSDWNPDNYSVTGFVTAARDSYDFDVGGYTVRKDACVQCATLAEPLATGTYVRVSGRSFDVTNVTLLWPTGVGVGLVGPVDAIDAAAGSLTVLGITVQTSPATHTSADEQPWVGSATLDLAELGIGNTVTVSGNVLGDIIVAGRVGRVGEGTRIRTRAYERADPAVVVLGRQILTDAATTVLACDFYTDDCTTADASWLFSYAGAYLPTLSIDIDTATMPLRATQITAYYYP